MERLGGRAGQLGQALGRAAGRGGEERPAAARLQDGDDRLGGRGLADAGAAGEDAHLAGEGHLHGGALALGQREAALVGVPGEGSPEIDALERGEAVGGRGEQRGDAPDDVALGVVVGRQVDHVAVVDPLAAQVVGGEQALDRLARALLAGRQHLHAAADQVVLGQVDVALVGGLPQQVERGAHRALGGVGRDAELGGDLVGGLEADAVDLARQAVGVVLDHGDRGVAVALVDAHRQGGGDAVVGEEDHHLLDRALLAPGLADDPGALRADARHLGQPLRRVVDHRERLLAEALDDPLGHLRADPLDHPRAEVFADAVDRGGQDDAAALGDELPAVLGVALPAPGQLHAFADVDRGQVADDGGEVALPRLLQPRDRVPVLGVDVGQPLDHALQPLDGRAVPRLLLPVDDRCLPCHLHCPGMATRAVSRPSRLELPLARV